MIKDLSLNPLSQGSGTLKLRLLFSYSPSLLGEAVGDEVNKKKANVGNSLE
jgi:hypothetical protein